ncbi:MAG: ParB/RepB/Spo0J family partition protein [Endozoicomonadaceae bacterium]|nr:ParB/RepB/Spo0J family partition protein [Endozoicomonadaceae bacterium]
MPKKTETLGKGLNVLLEGALLSEEIHKMDIRIDKKNKKPAEDVVSGMQEMPIEWITLSQYQPRKDINPDALQELAQSIQSHGIMQPIVVRPAGNKKYELIAGERRWRACQLAGLSKIPTVVKAVSAPVAMAMALIENIQRENLNAMEEANALFRLKKEFNLTQQEIAESIGKSRVSVTNLLRLLNLQSDVQRFLEHGDLEMGHARALLGLSAENQLEVANCIIAKNLSVRQTETLVRQWQDRDEKNQKILKNKKDPNIRTLEDRLSSQIGARVEIQVLSREKGKLIINYQTLEELDGILQHIV